MKVDIVNHGGFKQHQFKLSGIEFIHYFDMFNSAFNKSRKQDKKWTKMPYEVWRDMRGHDPNIGATILYSSVKGTINIDAGKKYCDEVRQCGTAFCPWHQFHYGDRTFGQFLYETFIKEQVKEFVQKDVTGTVYYDPDTGCEVVYSNGTISLNGNGIFTGQITTDTTPYSNWGTITGTAATSVATVNTITDALMEHENKYHKENETMKFGNFDFGPCTNDNIRMSMYGLAVRNASGAWVSYDANSLSIMDVDCFNFEGGKYLYKMPVAIHDIAVGDVVIHARRPMFVVSVDPHTLTVVDPVDGEAKSIMPTKSPFGFNFATKVVNLLGGMMNGVNANNPFGNMWMLMLMDGNKDTDNLLPLMMMSQGGDMMNNPMMMYFMMKDNKNFDPMMLMFMMNGNNCGKDAGMHRRGQGSCGCPTQAPVDPDDNAEDQVEG